MSTNVSLLAVQAKTDRSQHEALWNAVYRLIAWWAVKYSTTRGTRLYEKDDLIQSGYLALHDAVRTYELKRGGFTTHLRYYVQTHFSEVIGLRGTKKRPEIDAVSLNEKIDGDADICRADVIADPTAEFANDIIDREAARQDFAAIIADIEKLPDMQRRALMLTAYDGLTDEAAGMHMEISISSVHGYRERASFHIRNRTKAGKVIRDQRIHKYDRHVTLDEYKRTGISSVEWSLINAGY